MFVVWQVYNELRTVFNEVKEKRDKLAEEFNSLNAAHDPLKRRLTESNRKSHGLSQEITKTVSLIRAVTVFKTETETTVFPKPT